MKRRTEDLSRGRVSLPGSRYFVTVATKSRVGTMGRPEAAQSVINTLESLETDGNTRNVCAVVMPDHFHWLFELGGNLSLSRTVSKFKASLSREPSEPLQFQRNFHDHHLRIDDETDAFGLYMFLNPYRAGLCEITEHWMGWKAWQPRRLPFLDRCRKGILPHPEWVGNIERPF